MELDNSDFNMLVKAESEELALEKAKVNFKFDRIIAIDDKESFKLKRFGMLGNPVKNPFGNVSKSIKSARKVKRTNVRKAN